MPDCFKYYYSADNVLGMIRAFGNEGRSVELAENDHFLHDRNGGLAQTGRGTADG
jgi:hypothetical protein